MALVSGWLLSVANVGDTCAILHTGDKVMEMTRSHRLDDCPDERKRLSESGAHLASLGYLLKGPAEPGENGIGPLRVWPGGLAVGRSIGDTDVSPHVLPLPHVRQVRRIWLSMMLTTACLLCPWQSVQPEQDRTPTNFVLLTLPLETFQMVCFVFWLSWS